MAFKRESSFSWTEEDAVLPMARNDDHHRRWGTWNITGTSQNENSKGQICMCSNSVYDPSVVSRRLRFRSSWIYVESKLSWNTALCRLHCFIHQQKRDLLMDCALCYRMMPTPDTQSPSHQQEYRTVGKGATILWRPLLRHQTSGPSDTTSLARAAGTIHNEWMSFVYRYTHGTWRRVISHCHTMMCFSAYMDLW